MTVLALTPPRTVHIGPNWFASVMGTGIVANAAATVPLRVPGVRTVAGLIWLSAVVLLAVLVVSGMRSWVRDRTVHRDDPVLAQFWGAPPMALMTVGGGALLVGRDWIGLAVAVRLDELLWTLGTITGVSVAVAVPYLMMTRHRIGPDAAFGGWLMPVVPPMVSAANGALLLPYLPDRSDFAVLFYALFGVSLITTLIIVTQLWSRLVNHQVGPAVMVPTLWIVLGPLGQSITAAHLLAVAVRGVLPAPLAAGAEMFQFFYGVPTLGFALLWLALATAITVRTARTGLPFSLTWWSFTFPVGTMTTGTTGLALALHSGVLAVLAIVFFAALVAAWVVVSVRTVLLTRS